MKYIHRLFSSLGKELKKDAKRRPLTLTLECLGTIACLVTSMTLAIMGNQASMLLIFSGYLLGNLLLTWAAELRRNSFYLLLNVGYLMINSIGLFNALK